MLRIVLIAAVALMGCAHGSRHELNAKIRDSSIDLSRKDVLEGQTTITITNQGGVMHSVELETVSGGGNQRLVYEQRPFDSEKVVVPLRPGRYRLFCPDHSDAGVHATFEVVPRKDRHGSVKQAKAPEEQDE